MRIEEGKRKGVSWVMGKRQIGNKGEGVELNLCFFVAGIVGDFGIL